MISAILPTHDADTIALDFGVFIAERARTYRVSQAAILSAINPLMPSQPIGPAAVTSIAPQPDVQAEGVTSSSATLPPSEPQPTVTPAVQAQAVEPSYEDIDDPSRSPLGAERAADPAPIPEAPKPLPDDEIMCRPAEAKTSDQGALSSEPGGMQDESAVHPANPIQTESLTVRNRVKALHDEHPELTAKMAQEHLGITKGSLAGQTFHLKIKWARDEKRGRPKNAPPPETRDEFDARLVALHQAEPQLTRPELAIRLDVPAYKARDAIARLELDVPRAVRSEEGAFVPEVVPHATPQTPVALPPKELKTLNDRVAALHYQHPTWTGRMIANELGANPGSVSVALARIRNPKPAAAEPAPDTITGLPNVPAGAEERALKANYADVRKRLGAPQ